jgi:hypothetical protein
MLLGLETLAALGLAGLAGSLAEGAAGNALWDALKFGFGKAAPSHGNVHGFLIKAFRAAVEAVAEDERWTTPERRALRQLADESQTRLALETARGRSLLEAALVGRGEDLIGALAAIAGDADELDGDTVGRTLAAPVMHRFATALADPKNVGVAVGLQREVLKYAWRDLAERLEGTEDANVERHEELMRAVRALADDRRVQERLLTELPAALNQVGAAVDDLPARLVTALRDDGALVEALSRALAQAPAVDVLGHAATTEEIARLIERRSAGFVGREREIRELDRLLRGASRVVVVTGEPGMGKSALVSRWLVRGHAEGAAVVPWFFGGESEIRRSATDATVALRTLLRGLCDHYGVPASRLPSDQGELQRDICGLLAWRAASDHPITMVIDGFDEADAAFTLPVPETLPGGVHVLVTVRAPRAPLPNALRDRLGSHERLHLEPLGAESIGALLAATGEPRLVALADDAAFRAEVRRISGGLPLYLRFLIEDLKDCATSGEDPAGRLRGAPEGLKAYVERAADALFEPGNLDPGFTGLFTLLTVTRGPLAAHEVGSLTGLTLPQLLGIPPRIARWLSIVERDGRRYAFGHRVLAERFREALDFSAEKELERVIAWSRDWSEDRPYALMHLHEHLADPKRPAGAGHVRELASLAASDAFASAQRAVHPDDPDLPLRTARTALMAALDARAWPDVGTLVLTVGRRGRSLTNTPPFEVLERTGLRAALRTCDLYDPHRRVLWHLALALELQRRGDGAGPAQALEHLLGSEVARLPTEGRRWQEPGSDGWKGELAVELLGHLTGVDAGLRERVVDRVLDGEGVASLARWLAGAGELDAARTELDRRPDAGAALLDVGRAYVSRGDSPAALELAAAWSDEARLGFLLRLAAMAAQNGSPPAPGPLVDAVLGVADRAEDVPIGSLGLAAATRLAVDGDRAADAEVLAAAAARAARDDEDRRAATEALCGSVILSAARGEAPGQLAGRLSSAERLVAATSKLEHRVPALLALAQAELVLDRAAAARERMTEAIGRIEAALRSPAPPEDALDVLVGFLTHLGPQIATRCLDRLEAAARTSPAADTRPDLLVRLAHAWRVAAADDGRRLALLDEVAEEAQRSNDARRAASTLISVAEAHRDAGDRTAARAALEGAATVAGEIDFQVFRDLTRRNLAVVAATLGDLAAAARASGTIDEGPWRTMALTAMAGALRAGGRHEEALRVLTSALEPPGDDVAAADAALLSILTAAAHSRDAGAPGAVVAAASSAISVPSPDARAVRLWRLAERALECGCSDDGRRLIGRAFAELDASPTAGDRLRATRAVVEHNLQHEPPGGGWLLYVTHPTPVGRRSELEGVWRAGVEAVAEMLTGDATACAERLRAAAGLARDLPPETHSEALAELAVLASREGVTPVAHGLLEEAVAVAEGASVALLDRIRTAASWVGADDLSTGGAPGHLRDVRLSSAVERHAVAGATDDAETAVAAIGHPMHAVRAMGAWAVAERAAGREEAADRLLERAAVRLEDAKGGDRWNVDLELAIAEARCGRTGAAVARLGSALEQSEGLGWRDYEEQHLVFDIGEGED